MESVLTFSGWGQQPHSLEFLAPGSHVCDYRSTENYEALAEHIRRGQNEWKLVIGWSLGAQLACRLLAEGVMKAEALVMIAPPYQYVATRQLKCGTSPFLFQAFRKNFEEKPQATLRKFAVLSDMDALLIKRMEAMLDQGELYHHHWLRWLDILGAFSCETLPMLHLPYTLIIHARNDMVTSVAQADRFSARLANAQLEILADGGHIPHLHHEHRVRMLIESAYARVM